MAIICLHNTKSNSDWRGDCPAIIRSTAHGEKNPCQHTGLIHVATDNANNVAAFPIQPHRCHVDEPYICWRRFFSQ